MSVLSAWNVHSAGPYSAPVARSSLDKTRSPRKAFRYRRWSSGTASLRNNLTLVSDLEKSIFSGHIRDNSLNAVDAIIAVEGCQAEDTLALLEDDVKINAPLDISKLTPEQHAMLQNMPLTLTES